MQNFALLDDVFDRAGHLFDRHARVDAVLVIQVDMIGPQSLKAIPPPLFGYVPVGCLMR